MQFKFPALTLRSHAGRGGPLGEECRRKGKWSLLYGVMLLAAPAAHAQFTYYTNSTIIITGYTGTNDVIAIPSTINGLPVTTIYAWAFRNNTNLASVTIPNSVTSIGQ